MRVLVEKLKPIVSNLKESVAGMKEIYDDFIKDAIGEIAAAGGTRADAELTELRLGPGGCADCPFKKVGESVAYVESDLCGWINPKTGTACNCVVDIKARFLIYRNPTTMKLSSDHCPRFKKIDTNYQAEQNAKAL